MFDQRELFGGIIVVHDKNLSGNFILSKGVIALKKCGKEEKNVHWLMFLYGI